MASGPQAHHALCCIGMSSTTFAQNAALVWIWLQMAMADLVSASTLCPVPVASDELLVCGGSWILQMTADPPSSHASGKQPPLLSLLQYFWYPPYALLLPEKPLHQAAAQWLLLPFMKLCERGCLGEALQRFMSCGTGTE